MTDILPPAGWPNVRQLETNEYATGGFNGNMNEQAKSLAARSELLKRYAALPYESKTGGYALNERVQLATGDIVRSTIASNVNNPNTDMTGWVKINDASQIFDKSGKTQQEINDNYNRGGTPYFRTIFEFMPKSVIDDVFGAKALDHAPYLQKAIDTIGQGGVLWIPLTASAQINIGQTINITNVNKSLRVIGSKGTASRDSSLTTFRWTGATNGGIMFDILQSWGITFEDCSFNGMDKASQILRLRSEDGVLPVRVSHRHSFIRCGFENAYGRLVTLGSGINEDLVNVKFDSCSFTYTSGNTTEAADCGIYIDAPQAYCLDFQNCFFIRPSFPYRMFHIRSGNININDVAFDGAANSVDIYFDPNPAAISPQLTVTHAETQSDWFLKTASGVGLFPTRTVLLQNIRHRADNGQETPKSIYWDLGHQCQLVHVGCAFSAIEVGPNAASVVEVAPQWGRQGGSLYKITGYLGNTSVVTGLNGFNITEANRTIKGGLRVGGNFFSVCPSDANNDPSLFTGNKIDGDAWLNNKGDLTKALPNLYRYQADGTKIALSDSAVYTKYTRTVVANASKYNYILDFPIVPQVGAIYEVRWNIKADNANTIYEAGVMHVAMVGKGSSVFVKKVDVSLFQETTPILTTAVALRLVSNNTESASTSISQTALDLFTLRIKFLNALDNVADGTSLRCSIKRVGF